MFVFLPSLPNRKSKQNHVREEEYDLLRWVIRHVEMIEKLWEFEEASKV